MSCSNVKISQKLSREPSQCSFLMIQLPSYFIQLWFMLILADNSESNHLKKCIMFRYYKSQLVLYTFLVQQYWFRSSCSSFKSFFLSFSCKFQANRFIFSSWFQSFQSLLLFPLSFDDVYMRIHGAGCGGFSDPQDF